MARMNDAMIYTAIHEWYMKALRSGTSLACDVYLDGDRVRTAATGLQPGEVPGRLILEDVTATDYIYDDPATYTAEEFATACMISHGEVDPDVKEVVYIANPFTNTWATIAEDEVTEERLNALAVLMDDKIREELHAKLAPCTPWEFWKAYVERVGSDEAGILWFS